MKLLVATHNPHKLEEILTIFARPGLSLLSMRDIPDLPEVIEDGDTLAANACKKAIALSRATGLWALADDTGLEVAALNGEPGVYSARYAGEHVSYAANNEKLLANLVGQANRRACFRSVIALTDPAGNCHTVEGRCEGFIAESIQGGNGFGYDPVFIPEGGAKTFAELTPAEKNRVSHRGKALRAAALAWADLLQDR
ncbi:MAG: RdgB/HAM1 family non-canonical purine NTP pyrophosphatase [Verrucomicrobia bacterium]|nr:RdgB/HAM1 family non-canonical purine NTP pyrophosphatase [Verrucomicrobiota bacterium]